MGDALMTGRIQNPRMAGVGHMVQGWRWKGVETVVQYVSRLGSCFSGGKFIGSKENQRQESHPTVREDGKIYISVTAGK